jgi:nucleoside-diphosphate-sugar epimerase
MRVLVTGNLGYIGTVLTPLLAENGHDPIGLDVGYFQDCFLGNPVSSRVSRQILADVRDVQERDLVGIDAIVHLAALSNDPMGELDPELTLEINYRASVRLAKLAKSAGVGKFVFASSCSVYGQSDEAALTESTSFNPQTAYAKSKVLAEAEIRELADESFSPIFMRNATAYGYSPRLRFDLAVNNLAGWGFTTKQVVLLSDGMAWRPFVHVEDIARAAVSLLEARTEIVRNEAFNVGSDDQNYRIRDVANSVAEAMPGCLVTFGESAGADNRTYNVSFDKLRKSLPGLKPRWNVETSVRDLADAFRAAGLDRKAFESRAFTRLKQLQHLISCGEVDAELRRLRQTSPSA